MRGSSTPVPRSPGVNANPTTYLASKLIVAKGPRYDEQVALLRKVALGLDWRVTEDGQSAKTRDLAIGVRTVTIKASSPDAERQPDAWVLLRRARRVAKPSELAGIGLDHVVSTRPYQPMPFEVPHTPDPNAWLEPYHLEVPHPFEVFHIPTGAPAVSTRAGDLRRARALVAGSRSPTSGRGRPTVQR